MESFLLPHVATGVSPLAVSCLSGATPRGQPWTSAVTLPHGRNELNAQRMAVWYTWRAPSLCRHVPRELMRSALLDLTPIIAATPCNQRNYVERYSRSMVTVSQNALGDRRPHFCGGQVIPLLHVLAHLEQEGFPVAGRLFALQRGLFPGWASLSCCLSSTIMSW